jgi:hypothetical protein
MKRKIEVLVRVYVCQNLKTVLKSRILAGKYGLFCIIAVHVLYSMSKVENFVEFIFTAFSEIQIKKR